MQAHCRYELPVPIIDHDIEEKDHHHGLGAVRGPSTFVCLLRHRRCHRCCHHRCHHRCHRHYRDVCAAVGSGGLDGLSFFVVDCYVGNKPATMRLVITRRVRSKQ
jgi:hypothetical protein